MNPSARPFLILFCAILALLVGAGVALAITVHNGGMLRVDVHAKGPGGCDVTGLRIPGAFVSTAMHFIPEDALAEMADELAFAGPLAGRAIEELEQTPDFVLVEVVSDDEQVLIRKLGRELRIDVDSYDEEVHITVPLGTLKSLMRRLESI